MVRELNRLKEQNPALEAGADGGTIIQLPTENSNVYALCRQKDNSKVIGIFNLSSEEVQTSIDHYQIEGTYYQMFEESSITLDSINYASQNPWEYKIYFKKKTLALIIKREAVVASTVFFYELTHPIGKT